MGVIETPSLKASCLIGTIIPLYVGGNVCLFGRETDLLRSTLLGVFPSCPQYKSFLAVRLLDNRGKSNPLHYAATNKGASKDAQISSLDALTKVVSSCILCPV